MSCRLRAAREARLAPAGEAGSCAATLGDARVGPALRGLTGCSARWEGCSCRSLLLAPASLLVGLALRGAELLESCSLLVEVEGVASCWALRGREGPLSGAVTARAGLVRFLALFVAVVGTLW